MRCCRTSSVKNAASTTQSSWTTTSRGWWRFINFLKTTGCSGIVLNPGKFIFCAQKVELAGFHISNSRVSPLPKYLDAIKLFPTPRNITDIGSWFGLVNQVLGYDQLRRFMLKTPFGGPPSGPQGPAQMSTPSASFFHLLPAHKFSCFAPKIPSNLINFTVFDHFFLKGYF